MTKNNKETNNKVDKNSKNPESNVADINQNNEDVALSAEEIASKIINQQSPEEDQEATIASEQAPAFDYESLKLALNEADLKTKTAYAELENTRRRLEKEKQDALKFGITRIAGDLLAVADNLERALETDKKMKADSGVHKGVEMTLSQLMQVFTKYGISKIETAIGAEFDFQIHQAMGETETDELKEGSVSVVLQNGYRIHERLLRASMVMVAKPKNPDSDAEKDNPNLNKIDKTV